MTRTNIVVVAGGRCCGKTHCAALYRKMLGIKSRKECRTSKGDRVRKRQGYST